jgi:hypothetical protein
MQQDHSRGVLAGLVFVTLFVVMIASLSRMSNVVPGPFASVALVPSSPAPSARVETAAAGYRLSSDSSVPVTPSTSSHRRFGRVAARRHTRAKDCILGQSFALRRPPGRPMTSKQWLYGHGWRMPS